MLPVKFYPIVQRLNEFSNNKYKFDNIYKNVKVIYVWGKSGSGKFRWCNDVLAHNGYQFCDLVKYRNGFWVGISNECQTCIYDEFRHEDIPLVEFINFIDYNKHMMNIKNGSYLNEYRVILINSIENPKEIYKNNFNNFDNQNNRENRYEEESQHWLRRMTVYKIEEVLNQNIYPDLNN